ncbi:MAG: hypothetical protein RL223_4609, partial [Pseudomonadota bacterium]
TACATSPRPSAPAVIRPEIPAALRTPCRTPQALADGAAAAVRAWAVQTVLDARECAARHQALARALHPPAGSRHPSGGAPQGD